MREWKPVSDASLDLDEDEAEKMLPKSLLVKQKWEVEWVSLLPRLLPQSLAAFHVSWTRFLVQGITCVSASQFQV